MEGVQQPGVVIPGSSLTAVPWGGGNTGCTAQLHKARGGRHSYMAQGCYGAPT